MTVAIEEPSVTPFDVRTFRFETPMASICTTLLWLLRTTLTLPPDPRRYTQRTKVVSVAAVLPPPPAGPPIGRGPPPPIPDIGGSPCGPPPPLAGPIWSKLTGGTAKF